MTAEYIRPNTLKTALDALAAGQVTIAAGCTDLFAATEAKVLPGPVLDITAIAGMRGIAQEGGTIRIGAASTWSDIVTADLPASCAGLQAAAREVGARQVQNRGTIGGNLNTASPAADGMPPLLTLGAEVELSSATGTRQLPLDAYVIGPRQVARRKDELLTAVILHDLDGEGAFLKLGARRYLVISVAMASARLVIADGLVRDAAIAVGSCGPVATRLGAVEAALIGAPPDATRVRQTDVATALSPIDDIRADAAYRIEAATTLTQRLIAGYAAGQGAA